MHHGDNLTVNLRSPILTLLQFSSFAAVKPPSGHYSCMIVNLCGKAVHFESSIRVVVVHVLNYLLTQVPIIRWI